MADSFNELFGLGSHSEDANLEGYWKCQDNAANTTVDDSSTNANDGTYDNGGINTNDALARTTGPTNYLTSALVLNSSGDEVTLATSLSFTGDYTLTGWMKKDAFSSFQMMWGDSAGSQKFGFANNTTQLFLRGVNGGASTNVNHGITNTDWNHFAFVRNSTTVSAYVNGSSVSGSVSASGTADFDQIGRDNSTNFLENFAGLAAFSRLLTAAEIAQVYNGPEPINTVAPVVSGTETVGSTLSCTTGTWDSQSNGTLTAGSYSYQWTRSDDGSGTNEADIGGATSSTYTLVSGDSGKYIRCRVRASNDGGFDAAADTNSNFTGAISGGGSTYTLTASAATVAWEGQSATLAKSSTLTASAATVAWEGQASSLSKTSTLTASAATVAWEGQSATLTKGSTLTASAATVAWEGQSARLAKASTITASAATVAWAGQSADLTYSGGGGPTYTLTASAATVAWAGQPGTLSKASTLTGTAATVAWEGQSATLTYGYTLTASAATLAWEGQSGALAKSSTITSSAATLAWAGQAATLTYSGATSTPGSLQWSSPNVRLQWSSPDTRLQWS